MFFFTSDWHLTSRPKDEYRWEIFNWLIKNGELRGAKAFFILGDIADSKNHHPNEFINRLVYKLRELSKVAPVYMLTGNHDYTNPEEPLLRFLNTEPIVQYNTPTSVDLFGYSFLFVPNQKTAVTFGKTLKEYKASEHDFVLMHQTFNGSVTSNGTSLKGFELPKPGRKSIYISGDIHVPQKIGEVIYCGSPHPVHFGDTFDPRVLFWDGTALKSINRTTLKKGVLRVNSVEDLKKVKELSEGDQVKIVLNLPRSEFGKWEQVRVELEEESERMGWILAGIELQKQEDPKLAGKPSVRQTPSVLLKSFCENNGIDSKLTNFGLSILEND